MLLMVTVYVVREGVRAGKEKRTTLQLDTLEWILSEMLSKSLVKSFSCLLQSEGRSSWF